MASIPNPFTPDFGRRPPLLVGRDGQRRATAAALAAGPAHKAFTSLLLGPRGVGKTTVLTELVDDARSAGWRVLATDAPLSPEPGEGILADIFEQCLEHLEDIAPSPRRRLTGASVPLVGGGLQWESLGRPEPQLETTVDASVADGAAGVLLAVDEFHNLTAPEASRVASALQRITKIAQKPLAFIGVGLPHVEYTLLPNKGFTFFQRCHRDAVGNVTLHEAMQALEVPLSGHGASISHRDLRTAAAATLGYGFALQSVGYHIWELSACPAEVEEQHVRAAILLMEEDVARSVTSPIWNRLSPQDRRFLYAMLPDRGPTRQKDIAQRLRARSAHVSTYKRRLLNEGVIIETSRGLLAFSNAAVRYRALEERDLEAVGDASTTADDPSAPDPDPTAITPAAGDAAPPAPRLEVCGEAMPRAMASCVLYKDHKGAHRSRR